MDRGSWVRVERRELAAGERTPGVPPDTAAVPFESWVCGWLLDPADVGDRARVITAAGRIVDGTVVALEPGYAHSFGAPPRELQDASRRARSLLFGTEEPGP